jgi:pyridoxamine 5'-phosphate oxidase
MPKTNFRTEYERASLVDDAVPDNPLDLFRLWFEMAVQVIDRDPNAMSLATVGHDGQPQVRIVLCKEFDERGFVFFTNYHSRKGQDLAFHAKASLLFFWPALEQQVRICGSVQPIDAAASDQYFGERPRDARIGAWASPQSQVITSRDSLEQSLEQQKRRFGAEGLVPRPPHWGGYRLSPDSFEFWQGRPSRLHDRIAYARTATAAPWQWQRLAP